MSVESAILVIGQERNTLKRSTRCIFATVVVKRSGIRSLCANTSKTAKRRLVIFLFLHFNLENRRAELHVLQKNCKQCV